MAKRSAVEVTIACIERVLGEHPAFAKVDEAFYVVRQGTAYVYVRVVPWEDRALVRLVAQLVGGVDITPDLTMRLLRANTRMRFGAFGFVPHGSCVILSHTLLGGDSLDEDELLLALSTLALVADEYDDAIVEVAGGKRMQDLLDDSAAAALLEAMASRQ